MRQMCEFALATCAIFALSTTSVWNVLSMEATPVNALKLQHKIHLARVRPVTVASHARAPGRSAGFQQPATPTSADRGAEGPEEWSNMSLKWKIINGFGLIIVVVVVVGGFLVHAYARTSVSRNIPHADTLDKPE